MAGLVFPDYEVGLFDAASLNTVGGAPAPVIEASGAGRVTQRFRRFRVGCSSDRLAAAYLLVPARVHEVARQGGGGTRDV
jgi:hypothetical protein